MPQTLFPVDLGRSEWHEFRADGFASPACGLIHRSDWPARNGMPLGGIGTGCLDLETDGTLGYCTVFNSHVPRRGPLNLPFMGICLRSEGRAHESWVLSTRPLHPDVMPGPHTTHFRPQRACHAEEIHYWGHYPIADLEYQLDSPVSVGLRAWSPFIPGDTAVSNTPGAVFEVRLRNESDAPQSAMLAFSFPGPSAQEAAGHGRFTHTAVSGALDGVVVSNGVNQEYVLGGAAEGVEWRFGGDLGCDGGLWSRVGLRRPVGNPDCRRHWISPAPVRRQCLSLSRRRRRRSGSSSPGTARRGRAAGSHCSEATPITISTPSGTEAPRRWHSSSPPTTRACSRASSPGSRWSTPTRRFRSGCGRRS